MPGSLPDKDSQPSGEPDGEKDVKQAADPSAAAADVNDPAAPSPAEPDDTEGDMLSAVKAALEPKDKEPSSSSAEPDQEGKADPPKPGKGEGEEETPPEDLTSEEVESLSTKAQKRFRFLAGELRQRDESLTGLTREFDALKPKAETLDKLAGRMRDAGVTAQEFDWIIDLAYELKRSPEKAYSRLVPVNAHLQRMFGDVLPDDLQQSVARGEISEEHARELVRSRTRDKLSEAETARRAEADEERETVQAGEKLAADIGVAVTEWETKQAGSDPDWNRKKDEVSDQIELLLARNGPPKTAEDAVTVADEALKAVVERHKRFQPKPKPVDPSVTDVSSSPNAKAKPNSMLEAAREGLKVAAAG